MDLAALARSLRSEAERSEERRGIVLAGEREAGLEAARLVLGAAEIDFGDVTVVGPPNQLPADTVSTNRADKLLGTTREAVVLDAHEELRPNAVGQVVGAVDGGGLFVILAPPLSQWAERRDAFDERLAVPPFETRDVGGRFKRRFLERLQVHRGIAIVDVDGEWVEDDGLTDPAPRLEDGRSERGPPDGARFPDAVYDRCVTADQTSAVGAFEALQAADDSDDDPQAIVLEADRGRGKSSAAGLAAGAFAASGEEVLVTAPQYDAAAAIFDRAEEVLTDLDFDVETDGDPPRTLQAVGDAAAATEDAKRSGGSVRFRSPAKAIDAAADADVVIVDEAAALPVSRLESLLAADSVAFATTIHGYEGAGRGFSVRFRDRLAEDRHDVEEVRLDEPIRYAAGDPIEAWAFDALLLDARPAVDQVVEDATPGSVEYRRLPPEDLLADEHLLREVFGLLVLAHYRTEPDDLARLLDAPNVAVRALVEDGHVAAVALLAREGGLGPERRAAMYDGERIRGHMLPDVFTSQLRDEDGGVPIGYRVVRIATHHAARSRGLGSTLLSEIRAEFDGAADYLGVGYGATPELLSFWRSNGYETVHLSTTRNESSGEYSALMLDPLSEAGRALCDRHARWFRDRIGDLLGEHLRDADADVVRGALSACTAPVSLGLTDYEWRVVVGVASGPGQYATAPRAFRRLALAALVGGDFGGRDSDAGDRDSGAGDRDSDTETPLTDREERLLVGKVLQARPADVVADELGYESPRQCLRALGAAYDTLVDRYGAGNEVVEAERDRFDG